MQDVGQMRGAAALRHEPPKLAPTSILRGRLIEPLRGRFERRLTVITAGAGFGKSTLLAQAVRENRIEQFGVDAWLRVDQRDRSSAHLLSGLAIALGRDGQRVDETALIDEVWSRAPASVALIVDDTHMLADSTEAWHLLGRLLERLPANGHVVLSGRTRPQLDVAASSRLDDAVHLGEADLAFTDDEIASLAELRSIPPALVAELPRWPALATLTGAVGRGASIDYLWDEVLGTIPTQRRRLLAAVAPLGEVDDDLVARLEAALGSVSTGSRETNEQFDAATLVDGLPLVDAADDDTFRLHDLWTEALEPALDSRERAAALRAGAQLFLERAQYVRAAEAYALADHDDGLRAVVTEFARTPAVESDIRNIERLHALLPATMGTSPSAAYLEAARADAVDEKQSAHLFRRAADRARSAGDHELETLATWRVVQYDLLDGHRDLPLEARLGKLASEGSALARSALAFIESHRAESAGDLTRARACLDELDGLSAVQRSTSRSLRLIDLCRPEDIPTTLEQVLASGASNIFDAQSVWLQGQIDPDLAWPIARDLADRGAVMPATTRVSLNSVVVTMGIAAGALDEIPRMLEETRHIVRSTPGGARYLADVAAALADLVTADEDLAVEHMRAILDDLPLGNWPRRPYLYAISMLRGLIPGGEMLDGCDMGPAFKVAVQAGAALAALRRGDPTPARELPWHDTVLLRVHVPPPLLAELALAAHDTPGADHTLRSIPHLRTWAARVADRHAPLAAGGLGQRARDLVDELPERPPYDLRVSLLGSMRLERDGVPVPGWDRRERVRHLLALLCIERDIERSRVGELLWPGLEPEKAAANLRVNLHHLQQVLQPDRDPSSAPWFLQTDGSRLRLVADGVATDAEELVGVMNDAAKAEAQGSTSQALDLYRQIDELYVGDLLPGFDDEWAQSERSRLRSSAQVAITRRAELVLARGEPEAAMRLASRAERLDPLSERTQRLFIRCQLAVGSLSAARHAASRLNTALSDAGLRPAPETTALLGRLGV